MESSNVFVFNWAIIVLTKISSILSESTFEPRHVISNNVAF